MVLLDRAKIQIFNVQRWFASARSARSCKCRRRKAKSETILYNPQCRVISPPSTLRTTSCVRTSDIFIFHIVDQNFSLPPILKNWSFPGLSEANIRILEPRAFPLKLAKSAQGFPNLDNTSQLVSSHLGSSLCTFSLHSPFKYLHSMDSKEFTLYFSLRLVSSITSMPFHSGENC